MSTCLNTQYVPNQPFDNDSPNLRGVCSSNGICNLTTGACQCSPGWTGRSDFFADPKTDCQIFTLGIQIEFALLLLISLVMIRKQAPGLKKRYVDFFAAKNKARARGKTYGIRNNTAVLALIVWWTFIYPCFIITCILRIAATEERVGVTIWLTLFFGLTKIGLYVVSSVYQPYLFKILLKGSQLNSEDKRLKRLLSFINLAAVFSAFLYTVTSVIPFISVFDQSLQLETYISYQVISALALYYNVALSYAIYWKAEKLLNESYSISKDSKTLKLKATLKSFQFSVGMNAFIFGNLYIMQAVWPFWYNLHEYFHGVSWLVFLKFANDIALGTQESKGGVPKDKSSHEGKESVGTSPLNRTDTIENLTGDAEPTSMSV